MLERVNVTVTSNAKLFDFDRGKILVENSRVFLKKLVRKRELFSIDDIVSLEHRRWKLAVNLPGKTYVIDFGKFGNDATPLKKAFADLVSTPLPEYRPQFRDTKLFVYGSRIAAFFAVIGLINICSEMKTSTNDADVYTETVEAAAPPSKIHKGPFEPTTLVDRLTKPVDANDSGIKNWERRDLADGTERWMATKGLTAFEITPIKVTVLSALTKGSDESAAGALLAMGKANLAVFGAASREEATGHLMALISAATTHKDISQKRKLLRHDLQMILHSTTGQLVYTISAVE